MPGRWALEPRATADCEDDFGRTRGAERLGIEVTVAPQFTRGERYDFVAELEDHNWSTVTGRDSSAARSPFVQAHREGYDLDLGDDYRYTGSVTTGFASTPCLRADDP